MALADEQDGSGARLGWLKALTLLIAAIVVTHSVTFGYGSLPGDHGRVRSEIFDAAESGDTAARGGFFRMAQIKPGGMLASAGVRAGDAIRFEHPRDIYRLRLPEEQQFNLTILRDGQSIPTSFVTPASRYRGWSASSMMSALTSLFMAGAGLTIALRARGRIGLLLGATLVATANLGSYVSGWENDIVRYVPVELILAAVMALAPIGIFAFALMQRAEATRRPASRLWRTLFGLYALLIVSDFLITAYADLLITDTPLSISGLALLALQWGGSLAALGLLIRAAFETTGQERTRLGFLATALGLYFAGTMMVGMIINLTGNDFSLGNPLAVLGHVLALSGIAVFLYAALKHRVVDLGFAVNRTLVFGVLSTTLLFAFFFLEWGAEQIIPSNMREANLLASGGIAFVLFLVFHKAKDWAEKGVEHLFFRRWRDNEVRLRRFLKDAGYVTRADALRLAAVAEFKRFSGGAGVALYDLKDEAILRDGDLAAAGRIDIDAPALVRMRADREPLDGDLAAELGGEMALPVVQRAEVTGFFVVGAKPSGADWRPDEQALLAEAAQRIGQDLHALEIERLERELGVLQARLSAAPASRRGRAVASG